jgi:hypothetical protein
MPTLLFPNVDAVRRALAGGTVPAPIWRRPAVVGFAPDGRVWLKPAAALPRESAVALARLGAAMRGESEIELAEEVGSWLELVPLIPVPVDPADRPSTVLFDVHDPAQLPSLIAGAHRLGAGKTGIRFTEPPSPTAAGGSRALTTIASPPFHTLLRAAPHAYAEQRPRVWVEVGWRHPLAEMIHPPDDQIVLLRSPRSWEFRADGPFTFGPESFSLPGRPPVSDRPAEMTLPVPLRLTRNQARDAAELWVLRDRPTDQLRALAEQTDDRLLARLNVAIGMANGKQIVALRARPGRGGPPVLVLDALPCSPYLRLSNLYLPVDTRLRPPLRRDAVRRLLADDAELIVWLEPGESGMFTVHSLPATAFRPFDEVIVYSQENAPQSLSTVTIESSFDLPSFITGDRTAPSARRRPWPPSEVPEAESEPLSSRPGVLSRIVRWFTPGPAAPPVRRPITPPVADEPPRPLDVRDDRRRALEDRLLSAVNSPERPDGADVWPELARLYAASNRPGDATVCWLNALWESDEPPHDWSLDWLRAETDLLRENGADADWQRRLQAEPTPDVVRAVAAALANPHPSQVLVDALPQVQRLLDQHDGRLPVRAAWLARLGLSRLSGGDVVGLARSRDRLLERLHDHGLSADLDLPAALRFAEQGAGERVDRVRDWLIGAREVIHRWIEAPPAGAAVGLRTAQDPRLQPFGRGSSAGPTRAYADLILAWGLARLGDRGPSEELLGHARGVLAPLDAAHNFLLDAFAYRISQAREGRTGGPLPAELLARLVALREQERTDRVARERLLLVKVQHLLQHSRILEPGERVDAFREGWLDPQTDAGHEFAGLRYVTDREELANRLLPVVASAGRNPERLPAVLAEALDLAPRLGESIADGILQRLLGALGSWTFAGSPERVTAEVTAVERGLFVAAHFDRAAAVKRLVASLDRLLQARRAEESRPVEDALLNLVGEGLRGLRRLGLRAEADRLLERIAAWPPTPRRMLTLAGGWFYVGRDGPATEILDGGRRLLFAPTAAVEGQQTDLACAYAAALGHAPVRLALERVQELFTRLNGITDNLVTNTHYSLAKLRLVEAAVRAVVTDDFALGPAVRRWLDDDEYRVRRRIHRDVRALIGPG